MVDQCPKCGYDFYEYKRKGIEAERCPNCLADLRLRDLDEWEITCKACGSDIVDQTYFNKKNNIENIDCPNCGANLKNAWDRLRSPDEKKCPFCNNSLQNIIIEGQINFDCIGAKHNNNYFIHNPNGNFLNINMKCGGCRTILNNIMFDDMMILQQRLLSTFKVG